MAQADVVVTNDSGPMHLAAAVATPTVAIFGPTDPVKTGPMAKITLSCRLHFLASPV